MVILTVHTHNETLVVFILHISEPALGVVESKRQSVNIL